MLVRIPRDGAVIFDLDGTLVDSMAVVERHWTGWALGHGLDSVGVLKVVHGRPSIQSMRMFRPQTTLEESRGLDQREAADLKGLARISGAHEAVQSCIRQKIRWAIVTSGTVEMASRRLQVTGFPTPE